MRRPTGLRGGRRRLGAGDSPSVAVDRAGTAHIVFNSPGGETYCRLPRGARACDVATGLPPAGRTGGPLILRRPADGRLVSVQAATGETPGTTWLRVSADGGQSGQGPFANGTQSDVSGAALARRAATCAPWRCTGAAAAPGPHRQRIQPAERPAELVEDPRPPLQSRGDALYFRP